MGVPGFVAWLRDYFKDKMIHNKLPNRPKKLYIDGNCLIHPKCFEVLAYISQNNPNNDINIDKLEAMMFKRIAKYISYITNYVNPEICYFAVDGVAPAAKINQQRFRRYKSVVDNDLKTKLKEKYKINKDNEIKWSNTVITPGTEFMNKLHNHLLNYFKNLNTTNKNTKYIYTSYLEAGEGEHKIMDEIRNNNNINLEDIYVIYGLDADLFFLSMSCKKKNIYLLREEQHFVNGQPAKNELFDVIDDVAEDLRYVSIDITKECYDIRMQHIVKNKLENSEDYGNNINKKILERSDYCSDFVFLCYLLGNDFIPHLPTVDIKKNGLDTLIDCYVDTYINLGMTLLTESNNNNIDIKINIIFLTELIRCLGELEERFYKEIVPKYEHKISRRRCPASDEYSKELWDIENMRAPSFYVEDEPIKCGTGNKDVWKWRYYEYYYGTKEKNNHKIFVNLMCKMYIEGLMWVTKYYYNGCASWKWKYPFIHAPFISDIYTYLKESNIDINDIKFTLGKPLNPEQQLLAVLPYSCNNIVPKKYRYLMTDKNSPIKDMYPSEVKIDMIHKDMYWMCIPMLPYLDIDRIIKYT